MKTVQQTSVLALAALNISKPAGFDGSFATFGLLEPNDRIRVTNWVSAYVRNNPSEFTPAQVNVADGPDGEGWQAEELTPVSTLDEVEDFFSAVGDNAVDLIGKPLVNIGQSASYIAMWIPLLAIAAGAYFVWKNYK